MDIESFVRDGYVAVRGAFSTQTAKECRELIWNSLRDQGIEPEDSSTWTRPRVMVPCPEAEPFAVAGTSDVLAAAYDQLIGPGRWTRRAGVGGAVPVCFPSEQCPESGLGYHFEGSYDGPGGYWVNVRSRARGLLALFLFSDVGPDDAPTRLIVGSHLEVPPMLAPFGDAGVLGSEVYGKWPHTLLCRQIAHATGNAGDVYLCHPFIVHTATWPHRGTVPRMMAQPGIHVREGFAIDGSDPSPVAQAIVAGLGGASRSLKYHHQP